MKEWINRSLEITVNLKSGYEWREGKPLTYTAKIVANGY